MDTDSGNNVNRLSVIVMRPSRLSVYIYPGGSTQGMTRTQIRRPQDSPSCMMTGRVAYVHDLSSLPRWSYIDSPGRVFCRLSPFHFSKYGRSPAAAPATTIGSKPARPTSTRARSSASSSQMVRSLPPIAFVEQIDGKERIYSPRLGRFCGRLRRARVLRFEPRTSPIHCSHTTSSNEPKFF